MFNLYRLIFSFGARNILFDLHLLIEVKMQKGIIYWSIASCSELKVDAHTQSQSDVEGTVNISPARVSHVELL